jgi:hypothetical protein
MADPQIAVANQVRNIEARTGKTMAQLCSLITQSGLTKVGEQRAMLMEKLHLSYGDANTLALRAKQAALPETSDADLLDSIYAGPKAPLRKLHHELHAQISKFGAFETAPKKAYVSLRRKRQFATLGPATKDQIELGLNAKTLSASPRLKAMPPGGMCQYTVRLSKLSEIDAELVRWVRSAYDAAA